MFLSDVALHRHSCLHLSSTLTVSSELPMIELTQLNVTSDQPEAVKTSDFADSLFPINIE